MSGAADRRIDTVVIGAGLMGAATAWALRDSGRSLVVLERARPAHGGGSSHGSARIVRRAYTDPFYVRLTGRAFELWTELQHRSNTQLIRQLGGLDVGPDVTPALAELGVPYEVLDAAEAERRFVGMRFDRPVVFHPQAGTLDAERAVGAFLGGIDVRSDVTVTGLIPDDDGVTVRTDDGPIRARTAVVAAGAWTAPLLDGLVPLPALTVTQQQVFHFPRQDPHAVPWPSTIHKGTVQIYHLAGGRDGGPDDARKVAEHDRGTVTTADTRSGEVDMSSRQRVTHYVREWLPGLLDEPRDQTTCLYTTTGSTDFLIDRVGPLVVVSACSGHGAKLAPVVGEIAAGLVTEQAAAPERFRLTEVPA